MRKYKVVLYAAFGILAIAVMAVLLLWTFTRRDLFLFLSAAMAGVLLLFFLGLLLLNKKTGWRDEKTVRGRILGDAPLIVQLYFPETESGKTGRLVAAAYDHQNGAMFLDILKKQGEDADMGIFDDVYIGYLLVKPQQLSAMKKKQIVLSRETHDALRTSAPEEFFQSNKFLFL